ncbi:MAG: hypothetical protein ACUVS3_10990 [Thermodesulfobacteriota bacterium]
MSSGGWRVALGSDDEWPQQGAEILVDKEGQWYFRGAPIIRQDIVAFLSAHLTRTQDGAYEIRWNRQRCRVVVEDTPFVVWGVNPVDSGGQCVGLILELNDGSREALDPKTLQVGADNVPYCMVREGKFLARFSRRAYYQLARMIEEGPHENGFSLRLGTELYPIAFKG